MISLAASLYIITWAINGALVPAHRLRAKLPSFEDDFATAILKLAQMTVEATSTFGFRNEMPAVFIPDLNTGRPRGTHTLDQIGMTAGNPYLHDVCQTIPAQQEDVSMKHVVLEKLHQLIGQLVGLFRPDVSIAGAAEPSLVTGNEDEGSETDQDWSSVSDTDSLSGESESEVAAEETEHGNDLFEEVFFLRSDLDHREEDELCTISRSSSRGVLTRSKVRQLEESSLDNRNALSHYRSLTDLPLLTPPTNDRNSENWRLQSACVVCRGSERNILIMPCRCLAICDPCREELALRKISSCPTCRRKVEVEC
jgi:hypothetical protein